MTSTGHAGEAPGEGGGVHRVAVRGVAWLGVERAVNQLVALGVFILLGRLLDPVAFGLIAAANVVILLLRVVVNAGFARALVQREELEPEHADTAFWTSMALGGGLAVITFATAPEIAGLFSEPELAGVTRALSVVLVLAALDSTQSALVDRAMAFRVQAIRRLAATAVGSVVAVALALAGAGVWALVGQILTFEVVLVILLWSLTPWRPGLRVSRTHFGELFAFGTRYMGVRLLLYLNQNVDNFLIGWILGPVALGFYVIGYRVLIVFNELIAMTISQVGLPAFSRLQNDRARLHDAFLGAIGLAATAGWPLFAGLALLADQVIPFVFGAKWRSSAPIMEALALAGLVQVVSFLTQNLVIAVGRVRNEFRWNLFSTLVQIGGFALTAHWGVMAVAISLTVTTAVLWPIRVWRVSRWSGLSLRRYALALRGPALATVLMVLAVAVVRRVLPPMPLALALLVEVLAGVVAYGVAVPFVAPDAFRRAVTSVRLLRA